jgi:hypothetical protein
MRTRHALPMVCAALLVVSVSTGADYVAPPAAGQPVAAPPVEAPATTSTPTPAPQATPAAAAVAAPEATPPPQATPAPAAEAVAAPEATPPPQARPAPAADAAAAPEATPPPQATPAPAADAAAAPEATPPPQATPASIPEEAATVQATQPPPTTPGPAPPSDCAVASEPPGEGCRVPASVCSILGTDGDDLLTGTLMDDILCGFGGSDRLEGGDGDDVLLGGEGDDVLVGGEGDDCMVGGPGFDEADNTGGRGQPPAPPDAYSHQQNGEIPEWPEAERSDPFIEHPYLVYFSEGVTFDAEGRCTGAAGHAAAAGKAVVPRGPQAPAGLPSASAPAGAALVAVAASTSGPGGAGNALPCGGPFVVRRGVVDLCVPCSANAPAELVLVASSRRIAHKRFLCRAPGRTARVRLNGAGRRLVARERRVRARLLVLAAGGAVSSSVLLVSSRG